MRPPARGANRSSFGTTRIVSRCSIERNARSSFPGYPPAGDNPSGASARKPSLTQVEIDQRAFDLYDEYCHGRIDRREFLQQAATRAGILIDTRVRGEGLPWPPVRMSAVLAHFWLD